MNRPKYIGVKEWELLTIKYKNNYFELEEKIKNNYPVQYLIGNVDFCGNIINVNENVLIPRYETELLVENTLKIIKEYHIPYLNIIDIGTGSGCIAISLAKELNAKIDALDINRSALILAQGNAIINGVNINFIEQDILNYEFKKNYDIIISNPPYVKESASVDIQTKYEPQNAIFAKDNGLQFYKRILDISKNKLNRPGIIAFEIGNDQALDITNYAKEIYINSIILVKKDFNNFDRYLFIITKDN